MDDEVLGCGGIITSDVFEKLHVHYCMSDHAVVSAPALQKENRTVVKEMNCDVSYSNLCKANQTDKVLMVEWVNEFEKLIKDILPDTLFIPFPSYNQDHRRIHEAILTAARPHDKNFYVKNILVYEQPETFQTMGCKQFNPNVFIPIDVAKKTMLYEIYESQQRSHRSIEQIINLAVLRGSQSNCIYAEAFMAMRISL